MALLVSYQYAYTWPYHLDSRNHGQLFCPRLGSSGRHTDYNPAVMTWGHVNGCPSLYMPFVQIGTVILSDFFILATNRINYYYSWLQMYYCWSWLSFISMATAAPSPLASSPEKTNGNKLSRLLIDGVTMVLRNIFDHYHPPGNLASDLNSNYSILNKLLRKRVLNKHQWDKLFPLVEEYQTPTRLTSLFCSFY